MASIALVLLTLTSIVLAQDECEDGLKPIYIDFHDRNVSDNDQNIEYGLFIGIGTPFQNQSLWPSISHNETTFSSPEICDDNDSPRCIEQTHGFYNPEDSETFVNIPQAEFSEQLLLDTTPTDPASVDNTGNDTLNIYTHYFDPSPATVTHLTDFPISQMTAFASNSSPWYGPSGLLGLAPSSPILTHLLDLNLITTRSFGLYLGTAYPRAGGAINGSLTLGGYDSGRLTGDTHSFELANYDALRGETPFRVEIASVVLSSTYPAENSTRNETLSSTPFPAYLTTSQHSLTLPRTITESFIATTSASTQDNDFSEPSLYLPPDSSTNYTLTITLTSGLVVTIPADEMRNASNATPLSETPSRFAAPGLASNSNNSSNTTDDTEARQPSLLGTAFLHHLYLVAQYSSDATTAPQFHLSAASPHAPYVLPVPLCVGSVPREGDAVPGGLSGWERNGIIGAVLGAVIGGLALGWVVWWVWVRRRTGARTEGERVGRGMVGWGEGGERAEAGKGGIGKQWADAEDQEMQSWVVLMGRLGLGKRRGKTKGKGKAAYVDVERKSVGDHDGSSDEDLNGYGMRQFSPVAIPAAYGDGGRDRGYPINAPANTAPSAVPSTGVPAGQEIPFDFTPNTSSIDTPNGLTDLETPIFPDIQHHPSNQHTTTPLSLTSPSSVSWHEVTDIGRAVSTPALLVDIGRSRSGSRPATEAAGATAMALESVSGSGSGSGTALSPQAVTVGPAVMPTVVAVEDGDRGQRQRVRSMMVMVEGQVEGQGQGQAVGHGEVERGREGDVVTLRSISPVSPLTEDALFRSKEMPSAETSTFERQRQAPEPSGVSESVLSGLGTRERGVDSWVLSRQGSELGLLTGYSGEARTGAQIKIKNKIPRKVVRVD